MNLRYAMHEWLHTGTRVRYARDTVLVLIGDDEYWKGPLARRVPIKRDYLAQLLQHVDRMNPAVVAIDFALRSPSVDGSLVEHPAYQAETDQLLRTVREVAQRRPVVLPRTIAFDSHKGGYVLGRDVHDGFHWGEVNHNVRFGYISLPFDRRRIPVSLSLQDGSNIDSFALAIVRAFRPDAVKTIRNDGILPFGRYLPHAAFVQYQAVAILMADPRAFEEQLRGKIVILGGSWSSSAHGRGPQIDMHVTPIGQVPGAVVHANYVEALLDRETSYPAPVALGFATELLLVMLAAVIFAAVGTWYWRACTVLVLCAVPLGMSYVLFQNVGVYFDAVVPLAVVGMHALLDEAREWRVRREAGP